MPTRSENEMRLGPKSHVITGRSTRTFSNPSFEDISENALGGADFEIIPTNNILPAHHLSYSLEPDDIDDDLPHSTIVRDEHDLQVVDTLVPAPKRKQIRKNKARGHGVSRQLRVEISAVIVTDKELQEAVAPL